MAALVLIYLYIYLWDQEIYCVVSNCAVSKSLFCQGCWILTEQLYSMLEGIAERMQHIRCLYPNTDYMGFQRNEVLVDMPLFQLGRSWQMFQCRFSVLQLQPGSVSTYIYLALVCLLSYALGSSERLYLKNYWGVSALGTYHTLPFYF